jgi:hypothetical protein
MGPTQRFDGKLPRSAWPASARRACPGPCSRLFDVHDRPRQATALTVGSTSASTCTHGRLRLLGRSNPPPVPISPSPIQSSPQHHPPETLFLDNTTPPARTTTQAPLQSLRPHLQNSTSPPGLVSSHHNNRSPFPQPASRRRFSFCCWVRANCRSPDRSFQRHPHTCRRSSDIWPVHHHSCPPSPFNLPPTTKSPSTTSSPSACRHSLAVYRLDPSPLLL